jgi:hypothetical protein
MIIMSHLLAAWFSLWYKSAGRVEAAVSLRRRFPGSCSELVSNPGGDTSFYILLENLNTAGRRGVAPPSWA